MNELEKARIRLDGLNSCHGVTETLDNIVASVDEQIFLTEETAELLSLHNDIVRSATGVDAHWIE